VSDSAARGAANARAALRARFAGAPALVREALEAPPPALSCDPRTLRRIRTTGIGSSESHARALAFLLSERLGLDARFTPTGALAAGPPPGSEADALIVFSQGLSPNARFALSAPERWRAALLVTAATPEAAGTGTSAWLAALETAGCGVVRFEPENEFDGLARFQGPLTGLAAALGVARAFAGALGCEASLETARPEDVAARIAGAEAALDAALAGVPAASLTRRFAFLASGGYAELASNLRQKLLEGLLLPLPPAWDLLEFAHGPFQQCFLHEMAFLALQRADAPDEDLWLARLRELLVPERHALLPLRATLPGVYALFEHEAQLDALVLRQQEAQGLDPARWPGRGREAALYRAAPERPPDALTKQAARPASELAALVWPELAGRLGPDATAVVPLGAIEQHGAHLPFATDAWIADALAARFCAQVPGAVHVPALPLGCSPEHAEFPGTLSLREETLVEVLADVVAGLAQHGFARVFLFSAHGGNAGPLRRALPRLRDVAAAAARERGAAPTRVIAHTDLSGLTGALQRAAAEHGVGAAAAGHHAGEIETSILLALHPAAVRREAFAAGTLAPETDAQALFYPSLRPNAPSGTVGDPRAADARRGARYLEVWTGQLIACFREGTEP
jgi:creatinine amidohydrolase